MWSIQKRERQEVQIMGGGGHWSLFTISSVEPMVEVKQDSREPRLQLESGQEARSLLSPFLSVAAWSLISASLRVPPLSADLIFKPLCLWAKDDHPGLHMAFGLHYD